MIKIFTVSLIGLLAILVLLFGIYVNKDNPHPIDIPSASHGKVVSTDKAHLWVTVDQAGNIYRDKEKMSLVDFEKQILSGKYGCIDLRVDSNCTFENLKPILEKMNKPEIDYTCFKVAEE